MEHLLALLRPLIPRTLYRALQPYYHRTLAFLGALRYGFPARHLRVIAVTGTKGKTSVTELLAAILREAGEKVALSNTIHFVWDEYEERNLYKMSMPGRFFIQYFLSRAVHEKCTTAVIEMTSEGARFSRHRYTFPNALIFTNLAPEHIESHGSFDAYLAAKLKIRDELIRSPKKEKIVITNRDDEYGKLFARVPEEVRARRYSLKDAEPHSEFSHGIVFTFEGMSMKSPLVGRFNLSNILAAASLARELGISREVISRAVEKITKIPGRAEHIDAGQSFRVVVDYAHTAESLEALYEAFREERKICVLGNCGGGRDTWKRPKMAEIADRFCDEIILTNEDPYDEDPMRILEDMRPGFHTHTPQIILDRREAIRAALARARAGDAVLITGKGTDPFIMGARGSKTEWSDAAVALEELKKLRD